MANVKFPFTLTLSYICITVFLSKISVTLAGNIVSNQEDATTLRPLSDLSLVDFDPEIDLEEGYDIPLFRKLDDPDAETLRAKIFNKGGGLHFRDSIKSQLNELNELLSTKTSQYDEQKRELAKLVYISEVTFEKCFANSNLWNQFETFEIKYSRSKALVNHIKRCHHEQLKICRENILQILSDRINQLDSDTLVESRALSESIEHVFRGMHNQNYSSLMGTIDYGTMIEALGHYLVIRLDSQKLARSRQLEESRHIVVEQLSKLGSTCQRIDELFSGSIYVYDHMSKREQLKLHPSKTKWLNKSKNCHTVGLLYEDYQTIEHAYKQQLLMKGLPYWFEGEFPEIERKWRYLKLTLFGTSHRYPSMTPDQTLKTLNEIIHYTLNGYLGPNNFFTEISGELELVEMSDITESRCLHGFIDKYELIRYKFDRFITNIKPYLIFFYEKQLNFCRDNFAKLIQQEAHKIKQSTPETVRRLDELRSIFREEGLSDTDITKRVLPHTLPYSRILARYLRQITNANDYQDVDGDDHNELDYHKEFSKLTKISHELDGPMQSLVDVFDRLNDADKMALLQDEHVINWLANVRICHEMMWLESYKDQVMNAIKMMI